MKNEEILRRAKNLWEKVPKFKPWMVQLPSGTVAIGLANKSGRSKKLLGLVYITPELKVLEELYVLYPDGSLQFARIASNRDEHLFLTSPRTVLEEEDLEDMVTEIIDQMEAMDPGEIDGAYITALQSNRLGMTQGFLYSEKIKEIELSILDALKWSETEVQFLEGKQRLLEE